MLLVLDVQVLDAERAAVGFLETRDQLAEAGVRDSTKAPGRHHAVEVGLAEAELRRLEQRMARGLRRERIEMRDQVPELAVRVDQIENPDHRLGGGGHEGRRASAVARQRSSVPVGCQLEAREEQSPALVDRARIRLVAPVLLGNIVLVREGDAFENAHRYLFF